MKLTTSPKEIIEIIKDFLGFQEKQELGLNRPDADAFLLFTVYFASKGGDTAALVAMRKISLEFKKNSKGNYVMRHKLGEGAWPSEEEYRNWADGILSPKKETVLEGLAFVRQELEESTTPT